MFIACSLFLAWSCVENVYPVAASFIFRVEGATHPEVVDALEAFAARTGYKGDQWYFGDVRRNPRNWSGHYVRARGLHLTLRGNPTRGCYFLATYGYSAAQMKDAKIVGTLLLQQLQRDFGDSLRLYLDKRCKDRTIPPA